VNINIGTDNILATTVPVATASLTKWRSSISKMQEFVGWPELRLGPCWERLRRSTRPM